MEKLHARLVRARMRRVMRMVIFLFIFSSFGYFCLVIVLYVKETRRLQIDLEVLWCFKN